MHIIESGYFSNDIVDFITLLDRYHVKYVVIGGEAVIHYGHARLTGDIDFFYDRTKDNTENLFKTLLSFWDGDIPGLKTPEKIRKKGIIFQFGVPPNRIDLVNSIDGVDFKEAWKSRITVYIENNNKKVPLQIIGIRMLIKNKRASGRHKDLEDLEYLETLDK